MKHVSVIDSSARKYQARAERLIRWLLVQTGNTGKLVECQLVGNVELPKNVLAFPADPTFPRPDLSAPSLGELYLNPAYIEEHGENFDYMLVHGFLHLLGYDHMKKSDRILMEKKERELLRQKTKSA